MTSLIVVKDGVINPIPRLKREIVKLFGGIVFSPTFFRHSQINPVHGCTS